jgi:DNA sulfur modification protein DndD
MRLIKARFEGFRLLDGAEFDFATEKEHNLTVIRAANESGKTTFLMALQWALFGDSVLPQSYNTLSMDLPDGAVGETLAEVTYDVEAHGKRSRFRLIRSVTDRVGSTSRPKSTARLFEVKKSGLDEVNVTAFLNNHMPPELREVFFTDGDRALSFIEGPRGAQQKRVRGAIEQMMGLPLLEDGLDHVKAAEREIRAKANTLLDNEELNRCELELEALDRSIPELEAKLIAAEDEVSNLTDLFESARSSYPTACQ